MTLFDLLKKAKSSVFITIFLLLLDALAIVLASYTATLYINYIIAGDIQKAAIWTCVNLTLWMSYIVINYFVLKSKNKVRKLVLDEYRKNVLDNIVNQNQIDYDSYISALNNDANKIDESVQSFFDIVDGASNFILALVILIFMHWLIALVSVAIFFFNYLTTKKLSSVSEKNEVFNSKIQESFTAKMTDELSGYSSWNLYNSKNNLFHLLKQTGDNFELDNKKVHNTKAGLTLVPRITNTLSMLLLLIVSVCLIFQGQLSAGSILTIEQLSGLVSSGFSLVVNNYLQCKGINAVLEERCAQLPEEDTTVKNINNYDIHINDLSFSYPDKPIFNGLNLTFEYGKKYLIIGPSGFGKTTLLNLLSKNINEYSGSITLGENEYSSMNNYTVHHYIGYVEQSPYIFKDTMRNNITLYHEYSDSDLKKAMDTALVSEFYDVDKVDEVINPDELSGGQNQRIALSRELINDHKVILFDESINAIDKEMTEEIIQQLLQLPQTVILVSHSYDDSMKNAFDQVIDMEKEATL